MLAKLSVMGLYMVDNTIFDPLTMPGDLQKQTFIDLVLTECAEVPVVHPNPATFKWVMTSWTASHLRNWQALYDTTVLEYNPIENYDRIEEWTDTTTSTGNNTQTDTGTVTRTGTETKTESGTIENTGTETGTESGSMTEEVTSEGTAENIDSATAYNTEDYAGLQKVNTTNTSTENTTGTESKDITKNSESTSASETSTDLDTQSTETTSRNTSESLQGSQNAGHTGRVHGNIGVTTSQQMILAQRQVVRYNLYREMLQDFQDTFCVMVW